MAAMSDRAPETEEITYSVGAVSRITGLSAHVLRAWETRHQAVSPIRTEGGTRRYRPADVARLRLLRAASRAGHPIGSIAHLEDAALRELAAEPEVAPALPLGPILDAIETLDAEEVQRQLGLMLAALGPRRFGLDVALPLLSAVGDRWEKGSLCIASEHLASVLVGNLLGSALYARRPGSGAPHVVFATPSGERHELGLLTSAVVAADTGARCTYLGADLPLDEIARAVETLEADALALGAGRLAPAEIVRALQEIRRRVPATVPIWLGGPGTERLKLPEGVEQIELGDLDVKIALLAERKAAAAG